MIGTGPLGALKAIDTKKNKTSDKLQKVHTMQHTKNQRLIKEISTML